MNGLVSDKNMAASPAAGKIMTVTGPVEPAMMGITLPHEHVMSTFGSEAARYPFYDLIPLSKTVSPYLNYVKSLGVDTLVDSTAAYFGRHPELLKRFSLESGLYILTNTGYYAAAQDRYVPRHAFEETVDQIADRWVREWEEGIDGTGIYPGFIKTAVDDGPLSEIDRKLIVAAAYTHRQTGLTIQTHTGDNWEAAQAILSILKEEGIQPAAWIWIHAHAMPTVDEVVWAARQGAWVSLDGLTEASAQHHLDFVSELRQQGLLHRVLLSHDGDSYNEGQSRPFHFLLTGFIPLLEKNGFNQPEIRQMIVDNPRSAYTVQAKLLDNPQVR
jgi:predicted metal-dependent phosphotriesterase family hydrolase